MNIYNKDLIDGLHTGLVDHLLQSKQEYVPQLLVNDKINGKKVLTTILNDLNLCKEFSFSVAFVAMSGVTVLANQLEELEKNKIKGKLLVSQYQNFTDPNALRKLLKFKNIELKIAVKGDFHAKGYLFKKEFGYDLIIGSSNLTDHGLCSNKEWNLKISSTKKGRLINTVIGEFINDFNNAERVDDSFINKYEITYNAKRKILREAQDKLESIDRREYKPNDMQLEALNNLKLLRLQNKTKALIISATGTGKTFLSAFDVKEMKANTFLFVVHRENIARAALDTFKIIFGNTRSMGLFTGNSKSATSQFLFSTIQTLSKENNLRQFKNSQFDYIVFDEAHRSEATSYQKVFDYFKPKFLLGMTATPERTDARGIFKNFDHNIACEIRLHRALQEEMLCNFHYFGITELLINDKILDDKASFNLLTSKERVERIIEKAGFYGCDNGCVRGLVFCRKADECFTLSEMFNKKGFKTLALDYRSSEIERSNAISRLESDNLNEKLDYIFTFDIFNEGIDIPKVNQIILLRPTQSAIIFVQQLGRGLRKIRGKNYLTVLDFIGNYSNNYMIPIALFGDTSYNKDTLRKLLNGGSSLIPGASTINFDSISKEIIYKSIDRAKLNTKKDLSNDYEILKCEIGRMPLMNDFLIHGSRDPYHFIEYSKSYYSFVKTIEKDLQIKLEKDEETILQLFSKNVLDGKRIEETIILKELFENKIISTNSLSQKIDKKYKIKLSARTLTSAIRNINFDFIGKHREIIVLKNKEIIPSSSFSKILQNSVFCMFFEDLLKYSLSIFDSKYDKSTFRDGFMLYEKYSRKDVLRILNWDKNPPPLNVGGYVIHPEKTSCPIFVTYKKDEGISNTINYPDEFISNCLLEWVSKSSRTLKSADVFQIANSVNNELRLPLFVKKHNGEGDDLYYLGDVIPDPNKGPVQTTIKKDDKGGLLPIVKFNLLLKDPVEDSLYEYLTTPFN